MWYVIEKYEFITFVGKTYDSAKFWSQCSHDTTESPRRLHAGFYQLRGDVIGNDEGLSRQGYGDLLRERKNG